MLRKCQAMPKTSPLHLRPFWQTPLALVCLVTHPLPTLWRAEFSIESKWGLTMWVSPPMSYHLLMRVWSLSSCLTLPLTKKKNVVIKLWVVRWLFSHIYRIAQTHFCAIDTWSNIFQGVDRGDYKALEERDWICRCMSNYLSVWFCCIQSRTSWQGIIQSFNVPLGTGPGKRNGNVLLISM